MRLDLPLTFLELGDATSRNFEISHGDDVWVSYREDTIKETNLLKIRRWHPELVRVRTFPKRVEATNGADWEWHGAMCFDGGLEGRFRAVPIFTRSLQSPVAATRPQPDSTERVRRQPPYTCLSCVPSAFAARDLDAGSSRVSTSR